MKIILWICLSFLQEHSCRERKGSAHRPGSGSWSGASSLFLCRVCASWALEELGSVKWLGQFWPCELKRCGVGPQWSVSFMVRPEMVRWELEPHGPSRQNQHCWCHMGPPWCQCWQTCAYCQDLAWWVLLIPAARDFRSQGNLRDSRGRRWCCREQRGRSVVPVLHADK